MPPATRRADNGTDPAGRTLQRHRHGTPPPGCAASQIPADRDKLTALQARLLANAASLLAPGGTLVYCTCSLEPEEGERQIESFLATNRGFRHLPISADELGGMSDIVTGEGDLRSLPCHMSVEGGMDGFFAARLTRL